MPPRRTARSAAACAAPPATASRTGSQEILPEGAARAGAGDALRELFEATAAALRQPDMEFELLLPDDDEPIEVRTAALAQWCQGFLYGLGAGAIPDASELPGEVGEMVRDFARSSRAGVDAAQDAESNESAYAELVEFVRVGVQLLFEELAQRAHPGGPGHGAAALTAQRRWRETSSPAAAAS